MSPSVANRPIKLLLINPRFPESFWSFRWWVDIAPGKRAINMPLGLATLAALCPSHWQVSIIDENVTSLPLDPHVDLIGVCGMGAQFDRQKEVLQYYRGQGYPVVVGGSYASLCPEQYTNLADWVVAGEAEYIWPEFCRDYESGNPRALYQETGEVNLLESPAPRYDLLPLEKYTSASMQFSRGCPYRCEFCDIIVMFGRRPRMKSPEQMGQELDLLRQRLVRSIFFVDDNFIGNKKEAKRLLRYLIDYQAEHNYRFSFSTEVSINIAEDAELLDLFRAANFGFVFIGIESPNEINLRETGKIQNLRQDMLVSIRTIYRHGIDVLGGFIVGFDNDDLATFDRQYEFIMASGIQVSMVGLLTALPRTPLYERLEKEGRLIPQSERGDNTKPSTNILPLRMDYEEMVTAYESLFRRLFTDRNIAQRVNEKMRYLRRPVPLEQYSVREQLVITWKLFVYGLLPGGPLRIYRFLRTLASASCHAWPQVVTDWIVGLSMREYVKCHFATDQGLEQKMAEKTAEWLRKCYASSLRLGLIEITPRLKNGVTDLQLIVLGHVDQVFSARVMRRLERFLRSSGVTLTICIEELSTEQHQQLKRLLRRLSPYGQRVSIWTNEQLRTLLAIDSSDFHVMLIKP
jgi:radical SAM superfamily enzyme YgiQ (UPF0313 family)